MVIGVSFELFAVISFDLHVGDGDRLVAVIGHHEENRQETMRRKIHRKNLSLFRSVVGVGGDGDLLVAMKIMRRIIDGCLRHRLHEVLAAATQGTENKKSHAQCRSTAQLTVTREHRKPLHPNYEGGQRPPLT